MYLNLLLSAWPWTLLRTVIAQLLAVYYKICGGAIRIRLFLDQFREKYDQYDNL